MTTQLKSKKSVKGKNAQDVSSDNLRKLFIDALKDIYWAEKYLVKSLPKIIQSATNERLKEALRNHFSETEQQVNRLERVFESCKAKVSVKKCEAMVGLVEECKQVVASFDSGPVLDAALIISIQKVEHYEIAAYGSLHVLADVLGMKECSDLLKTTLDEEHDADRKLNELAQQINQEAFNESQEKMNVLPAEAYI